MPQGPTSRSVLSRSAITRCATVIAPAPPPVHTVKRNSEMATGPRRIESVVLTFEVPVRCGEMQTDRTTRGRAPKASRDNSFNSLRRLLTRFARNTSSRKLSTDRSGGGAGRTTLDGASNYPIFVSYISWGRTSDRDPRGGVQMRPTVRLYTASFVCAAL